MKYLILALMLGLVVALLSYGIYFNVRGIVHNSAYWNSHFTDQMMSQKYQTITKENL